MTYRIGIRVHREQPPETVPDYVRHIENLGYDEAWVVEDLAYGGGLTTAAVALSATARIPVGIGVLASVVRNPVYTAMEIASLERMFPGRTIIGIGHGVQSWMESVGAKVTSPLKALDETLTILRGLLTGEVVQVDGSYVHADAIQLQFPPASMLPLLAGVRGPKSVALAGAQADGVLLAEPTPPQYVRWARQRMLNSSGNSGPPSEVAAYTWLSVHEDPHIARTRLQRVLADTLNFPEIGIHIAGLPFADELSQRFSIVSGMNDRVNALELDWVSELGVVGTPEECAGTIQRLADAGANRIILLPLPGHERTQTEQFSQQVRPLLT